MKAPPSSEEEVITWTTSQVVLATIFVVCVFLTFWLLYRLRVLLFLFFVAIVIGTAIRPAVEWLHRRGISRITGVIIIYILIASILIGFLAITLPLIADQATQFAQNVPQYYMAIRHSLVISDNRLLQNIGWRIPSQLDLLLNRGPTAEQLIDQVAQTIVYANLVAKGILSTLAVFLLAYYWTQESTGIIRTLLRLFPPQRRKEIQQFFYLAETKIGGYIRGQGILCFLVGLAAFFAYSLIGLPFTLVLGIIAGVMEMIPIFGPGLGAIPALLVALSIDPGKAIWVVVATGVIQMTENIFLVPRVMKNSMGVNPIIVLLSLVAFGSVFGFPGALLALPLAAILQLIFNQVLAATQDSNGQLGHDGIDIQSLVKESQELTQIISNASNNGGAPYNEILETDQLEINAIIQELNQLLGQLENQEEML